MLHQKASQSNPLSSMNLRIFSKAISTKSRYSGGTFLSGNLSSMFSVFTLISNNDLMVPAISLTWSISLSTYSDLSSEDFSLEEILSMTVFNWSFILSSLSSGEIDLFLSFLASFYQLLNLPREKLREVAFKTERSWNLAKISLLPSLGFFRRRFFSLIVPLLL